MTKPKVSAVVPARDSGVHINGLLESLLAQDYPNFDIHLSLEEGDSTISAIKPEYLADPRLVIVESPKIAGWVGRNSNRLRNAGGESVLEHDGDLLFFTDVKIRHNPDCLSLFVQIKTETGADVVGGIMLATEESAKSFLGLFTDKASVKRNPEFGVDGYFLGLDNFGKHESLPITACLGITREVFEKVKFPEDFRDSYEDYAYVWLIVKAKFKVFCTDALVVFHKHRSKFKQISREYSRSARGAAQMFATYPDCPFGRRRFLQVFVVLTTLTSGLMLMLLLLLLGLFQLFVMMVVLGFLGVSFLGALNVRKAKIWQAFFFPPLTIFFIVVFSINFVRKLIEGGGVSKDNSFLQTMWSYWFTWVVR